MVLGELLSSLWKSTNDNKTENQKHKQTPMSFPQGEQLLKYQQEKTQRLSQRSNMLTNPNKFSGFAQQSMTRNLNLAEGFAGMAEGCDGVAEGFTGMAGPTAVNKRNQQDMAEIQKTEDDFNRKLSNYSTAHKTLMDKAQRFITSTDSANIYANKNVKFADGQIGYVTPRGIFKLYQSLDVFNATAGKNGCPSNYVNVEEKQTSFVPGGTTNTTPPLTIGSPMNSGQACGDESRNIFVTQAANPTTVNANYEGCYKVNSNDGMIYQTDLGDKVSEETCKMRALDLGYNAFSLRDDGTGCSKCYVGNNINAAKSGGQATQTLTSYSFIETPNANTSGLLMNGQIGVGKDIHIGQGAKKKSVICPIGYTGPDENNKCIVGWSPGFGEEQAKNSCSKAGGTWIPLDYGNYPYTCQMPDTTNMKTQFNAVPGCLSDIGGEINSNTLVGTYGGNCESKKSVLCPEGYSGPNADNVCTTGWSSACGQECATSKCASAGGTWIPLDYRYNPYSCRMSTTTPTPAKPS